MKHYLKKIQNKLFAIGFYNFLDDKTYIKMKFKNKFGYNLDLKQPKTFNEKIQWLKLYDRRDTYSTLVDKYNVKKFVANKIGEDYIIPTLGVWNKLDEIDFEELPNQFVLKCTHDSGGLCIIKNKNTINMKAMKQKINKSLKRNYFFQGREWPYKNVKPRIIAEKYMEDNTYHELRDYKFFCFNGKVKLMFVASNRHGEGETYFDFFDIKYNHLDIRNGHPNAPVIPEKPVNYEKMIELAEKLSKDFLHVRVDFYEVNGKVYFGEMTLYHWSGLVPFEPEEWDKKLGEFIDLNNVK